MDISACFAAAFVAGEALEDNATQIPADPHPSVNPSAPVSVAAAAAVACSPRGAKPLGKEIKVLRDEEALADESFLLPVLTRVRSAMGATRAALLIATGGVGFCVGFEPPDEDGFAELVLFEPYPPGGGGAATTRFSSMRGLQLHLLSAIVDTGAASRPGSSDDVCLLPIAMPGHLDPKVEAMLVKVRKQAKATAIAQKRRELETLEANLTTQLRTPSSQDTSQTAASSSSATRTAPGPAAAAGEAEAEAEAEAGAEAAAAQEAFYASSPARARAVDLSRTVSPAAAASSLVGGRRADVSVRVNLIPARSSREAMRESAEVIAGEVAELRLQEATAGAAGAASAAADLEPPRSLRNDGLSAEHEREGHLEGQTLTQLAGVADQMAAALGDAPLTPPHDSLAAVDGSTVPDDPLEAAWQAGKRLAVELRDSPTRSPDRSYASSYHSPGRASNASQEGLPASRSRSLRGQHEDGLQLSSQSKPTGSEVHCSSSEHVREVQSARAAVPSNWDCQREDEPTPPWPEAVSTTGRRSPSALVGAAEHTGAPSLAELVSADASISGSALGSALGSAPATSHETMHGHEHEVWPQEGIDLGMDPATSHDLELEHLMDDLQAIRSAVARAEQGPISADAHVRQSASNLITAVDGQLAQLAGTTGSWRNDNNEHKYAGAPLTATTAASSEFGSGRYAAGGDLDRPEVRFEAQPIRELASASMNSTAMRSMLASLEVRAHIWAAVYQHQPPPRTLNGIIFTPAHQCPTPYLIHIPLRRCRERTLSRLVRVPTKACCRNSYPQRQ